MGACTGTGGPNHLCHFARHRRYQFDIASLFQEACHSTVFGFPSLRSDFHDLILMYTAPSARGDSCGLARSAASSRGTPQDFGAAAMVTYGLMVLVVPRPPIRWRARGFWLTGLAVRPGALPALLLAIGSPLNLSFRRSVPPNSPGRIRVSADTGARVRSLVVVPINISATAAGWALIAARPERTSGDGALDRAAITLAIRRDVVRWSAGSTTSVAATPAAQLQSMCFPAECALACLASIVMPAND